jgi:competence protein ComFC
VEQINKLIKSSINWLLDMLFPESCISCHTRSEIICNNCAPKIRTAERETDTHIFALYDYRDPVIKRAIWDLKYHKHRHLGEKLGKLLYEGMVEDISDIRQYSQGKTILVIPVPISRSRGKVRGYNQARVIAKYFCMSGGDEILELRDDLMIKNIETLPQARITNRTKRIQNIRGAFEIKNPEYVKGRTCIVIDDVTTTGATMNEIIKLLKKSGAKKVIGFAVAH